MRWVGEADRRTKLDLLAGARCLLFPIQWESPFGMVMIELGLGRLPSYERHAEPLCTRVHVERRWARRGRNQRPWPDTVLR